MSRVSDYRYTHDGSPITPPGRDNLPWHALTEDERKVRQDAQWHALTRRALRQWCDENPFDDGGRPSNAGGDDEQGE